MVRLHRAALFFILLAIGGCASRPLPEHVTGYTTYAIVNKIRCETREAVQDRMLELLADSPNPAMHAIGAELAADRTKFIKFDRRRLDRETLTYVNKYDGTTIAYDFTFDMTEKNDLGGGLTFLNNIGSTTQLGVTAANNRQRQNIRNFTIADNFGDLIDDELVCTPHQRHANMIYPITGSIGMAELIRTFLDLNESQNLSSKEKDKVPTLGDTLEFQTALIGSVSPSVALSPVGGRFSLVNANLTAGVSRLDKHKLVLGLSLPIEVEVVSRPARKAVRATRAREMSPGTSRNLSSKSLTRDRAFQVIRDQINRKFISDTEIIRQRLVP